MRGIKILKFIIVIFIFTLTSACIRSGLAGNLVQLGYIKGEEKEIATRIIYCLVIFHIASIDLILILILRIIRTVELKNQFIYSNVIRLKIMSICMWLMSVSWMIGNFIAKEPVIIDVKVIALFIIAIFTEILVYVFQEGYKLKRSQEELQRESSLTI